MPVWSLLAVTLALSAAPPARTPACSDLANQFCRELFDPDHQGHWDLHAGKEVLRARRGYTNNGLPESMARVLELRLERQDRFPPSLRQELERLGYFREAHSLLIGHSRGDSLDDELRRRGQDTLLPHLWSAALEGASFRQLVKAHPEALKLDEPEWLPGWDRELEAARNELARKANLATWEGSPEWVRAEKSFEDTRRELKHWLKTHPGLSELQAAAIEVDLDTLRLSAPGTRIPVSDACATRELNATYHDLDNEIEVCAGELFIPTLTEVMAHEMAHLLGDARQQLRAQRQLDVARWFRGMQESLCRGERISCAAWSRGRARLPAMLRDWPRFDPEPLSLYQCLQSRTPETPSDAVLRDQAASRVAGQLEQLASDNLLLTLTRKETLSPAGVRHPNPAYLNPCRAVDGFERKEPLASEVTGSIALVAAYDCAPGKLSPEERLESAIASMRETQEMLTLQSLKSDSAYSSDEWLAGEGYSEDRSEDFADFVAAQVFTHIIEREPDLKARRVWFMAAIADYCDEPGWTAEFPEETAIQSRFDPDAHAPQPDRRARFFRSAGPLLGCRVDTQVKSCEWSSPP